MIRVSIIGTAGRREDGAKMTGELFAKMKAKALDTIVNTWKLNVPDVILVSGGAAGADHVAVELFLDKTNAFGGMELHLPCDWDEKSKTALESNECGRIMNYYHRNFAKRIGRNAYDTLKQIHLVPNKTVYKGFHARNSIVAKSSYLIAFTWGESEAVPKDGGTLDTWKKCKSSTIKLHIPLKTLG